MRRVMIMFLLIGLVLVIVSPMSFAQEASITSVPAETDPIKVLLGVALAISEALALFPKIASNGIVHSIILIVQRLAGRSIAPVILLCILFGAMVGCGKTVTQIKAVAHNLVDVAGTVYEDTKDNLTTAKQIVLEPAQK
jgi:hypothetical protein